MLVVQNGSVDMIYLADRTRPDKAAFLKRVRAAVLSTNGVDEALYREPNPEDGGAAHTLAAAHPGWRIAGPRTGDLFVAHIAGGAFNEPIRLIGNHGSPATGDNIMELIGGGAQVRRQRLGAPAGPRFDDTLANPGQSQNADVAPTVMALFGLNGPSQSEGRRLEEAFAAGVLREPGQGLPAAARCTIAGLRGAAGATRGRRVRLSVPSGAVADVFQVSRGRRVLGNRRVARVRRSRTVRPRGTDGLSTSCRVRGRGAEPASRRGARVGASPAGPPSTGRRHAGS